MKKSRVEFHMQKFIRHFLVFGVTFFTAALGPADAQDCKLPGLCEILSDVVQTVTDTSGYENHGLVSIESSFSGSLELSTDLHLQEIFLIGEENRKEAVNFTEVATALKDFFNSLVGSEEENESDSGQDGLSLYESDGSNTSEYDIYLEYEEKYQAKKSELDKARTRSAKQFLADELAAIDSEWIALGLKFQFGELLMKQEAEQQMDPKWIARQVEAIEEAFSEKAITDAILNQISSDAWNSVSISGSAAPDGGLSFGSSDVDVDGISFQISVFQTISLPIIPNNVPNFMQEFLSEGSCSDGDIICEKVTSWLGGLFVVESVILLKNIRISLADEIGEADISDIDVDFAMPKYVELNGPFIYMSRLGSVGY